MAALAWGAKVTPEFRQRAREVAAVLKVDPSWLMAVMAFESGGTFRPDVRNAAGSSATGLIQFMPQTAFALGTTTDKLAAMTAVKQLDYVERYFLTSGRAHLLKTLPDLYMAVLWPAAIGKPDYYVLFDKADAAHPKRYMQNAGLDWNKDGVVTKAEASRRVVHLLNEGFKQENASE